MNWTVETVEALGWPLLERLEKARPEDVPDEVVILASNRNWRFEMTIRFTGVEEMDEAELNELFGLAP